MGMHKIKEKQDHVKANFRSKNLINKIMKDLETYPTVGLQKHSNKERPE